MAPEISAVADVEFHPGAQAVNLLRTGPRRS